MFKHGLIADRNYWNQMIKIGDHYLSEEFENLIYQSAVIKNKVVNTDPYEQGPRKALNYGHTIGHAIESFCLSTTDQDSLLHGEAIAAGLYLESYLSHLHTGLSKNDFQEIKKWYRNLNRKLSFSDSDIKKMLGLMTHDKKNVNGEIRFVLLSSIGRFKTDQTVPELDVIHSFELLKS
jgi:3-dehydroquinate synthase